MDVAPLQEATSLVCRMVVASTQKDSAEVVSTRPRLTGCDTTSVPVYPQITEPEPVSHVFETATCGEVGEPVQGVSRAEPTLVSEAVSI